MSRVCAWLDGRRPRPPSALAKVLFATPLPGRSGSAVEALSLEARDRLDAARARPGRVRESAFELLAADATITYACEAALEDDDPDRALISLLALGDGG